MPGLPELLIMMVFFPLMLVGLAGWIYALVDCVRYEPQQGNERMLWILVIAFTGWIGALVYWLARRPQRRAQFGR